MCWADLAYYNRIMVYCNVNEPAYTVGQRWNKQAIGVKCAFSRACRGLMKNAGDK